MIRRRHGIPVDELPQGGGVARDLDSSHCADPGELQDIGTCRTCGLVIGRYQNGTWSHLPSISENYPAGEWLNHHNQQPNWKVSIHKKPD